MIEREVNDIKANQDELKRINSILDENWTDSSAEQFKMTYLGPIEAAGTAFIGESFVHAHELRSYLSDIEDLRSQFERLKSATTNYNNAVKELNSENSAESIGE